MSPVSTRAAFALVSCAWAAAAAAQTVGFDRSKTEPHIATTQPLVPAVALPPGADAVVRPPVANDRLYRIHFTIAAVPGTGWTIEVVDSGTTWTSESLDSVGSALWSNELESRPTSATVRLRGPAGQPAPRVTADRVAIKDERPTPQAITPPADQSQSIRTGSQRIKDWGKSVARLQFIGSDGAGYYCTAFLVSASLMMTNNHCINTDEEMRSAIAEFDYDAAGVHPEKRRFKELVAHDENLDYSLIRLQSPSSRAALPLADMTLTENEGLLVIQHPAGLPKKFSRIDCLVRGVELPGMSDAKTDFGHFCDTQGGSSGSPVQDFQTGRVVGLHHLGFRTGDDVLVNRGVKIGLVLSDIAQRVPAARAEITTP
jgi:hypothetical protein